MSIVGLFSEYILYNEDSMWKIQLWTESPSLSGGRYIVDNRIDLLEHLISMQIISMDFSSKSCLRWKFRPSRMYTLICHHHVCVAYIYGKMNNH